MQFKISEMRLTDNAVPVRLELLLKLIFHELRDLLFVEHNCEGVGGLLSSEQGHIVFHLLLFDLGLS